jgi:hypothetical protein
MVTAQVEFPFVGARKVRAVFDAESISSDGGALLLRQVDRRVGLLDAMSAGLAAAVNEVDPLARDGQQQSQ